MQSAYWGVAESLSLVLPTSGPGWLLLGCYSILFVVLFLRDRAGLESLTWRKWMGWLILGVLALMASQLFPTSFTLAIFPMAPEGGNTFTVALLAAVPSLLAASILGPAPALFVGLSAGLGRALGQSHQIYDLFHYAFAAWLAGYLLHNKYHGRRHDVLRRPLFSGPISQSTIALMAGFALLFLSTEPEILGRLAAALTAVQNQIIPLFIEGFTGGVIVAFILLAKPTWKPGHSLVPSPAQRSVHYYLLTNLLLFSAIVIFIVISATFIMSTFVSTRLILAEMAANANATSARMIDFQAQMENTLVTFGSEENLHDESVAKNGALGRLYRSNQHYEQVLYVDGEQKVEGSYPGNAVSTALTNQEQRAVKDSLKEAKMSLVLGGGEGDESGASLIVPVTSAPEGDPAALIGRIKASSLTHILNDLAHSSREMSGAMIDTQGTAISAVVAGSYQWPDLQLADVQPVEVTDDFGGEALIGKSKDGAQQLVYVAASDKRNWQIAVAVPYTAVFSQAIGMAAPLVIVLLAVAGVFYARLANYSKNLSGSITQLARTSRTLAGGGDLPSQLDIKRQDELGELNQAFIEMQRGQKQQLEELSLLLSVSRETSTRIDQSESMPVILHGAIRGTGAAGARALTLNPSGGRPLAYAEGPAADSMGLLDSRLLKRLREHEDVFLGSPDEIQSAFQIKDVSDLRFKALYAVRLQSSGRFLGILAIGFRQARAITQSDRHLLHTLAGQAAGLVEKSYLFTHAERGRRRLDAVLASTSEAIIVTDQTSRIIMINRAMEKAFNIDSRTAAGRLVSDVINSRALARALSSEANESRNLEIVGEDRRTYFANTSTIMTHDGHALGRVALLHDATDLKELDRVKSEFVDNVSHDLRTPLTILSGYASALSIMDDLTPEQRKYIDSIMRNVDEMIGMVDSLMDLSQIEAGADMVFEDVDIGRLLRELADHHWMYAHDSGIRLHVRSPEDLPRIHCDEQSITRAVSNLLMNGFKYAPNSGDMTLAAEIVNDELIISVRDRGPGIAKTDQMRIFEKFTRLDRHSADKVKGHGLGLAMVKGIAEHHGGEAWCESVPGKGSRFCISIPLKTNGSN